MGSVVQTRKRIREETVLCSLPRGGRDNLGNSAMKDFACYA
jgi:hypothetical protein